MVLRLGMAPTYHVWSFIINPLFWKNLYLATSYCHHFPPQKETMWWTFESSPFRPKGGGSKEMMTSQLCRYTSILIKYLYLYPMLVLTWKYKNKSNNTNHIFQFWKSQTYSKIGWNWWDFNLEDFLHKDFLYYQT